MVIEKKYYDIAQHELEEMQREINEEKAQMSEEEILEDKKWHDEQLETIIKKAEAHMRRFKKVPDPQKVVKFTFLQKDALEIARNMQMNIKTERKEDDLWGTIEMSFNNMWFLDSAPSEWKDIWNNLLKEAQRVYIEPTYGKYGMLRKSYLQEHRRAKYQILLLQGKLVEHLNQIDAEARDREEQLVKQMMEKQGITEKLKRQDNMEWTRRMNTICHDAEEMILTEMIYTKG